MAFWVTGFGTFPGVPENPTEQLVSLLRQRLVASDGARRRGLAVRRCSVCCWRPPPNQLTHWLATAPLHAGVPGCHVAGTAVLEVAAVAAREWVESLFRQLASGGGSAAGSSCGSPAVVVLHLGVDVTSAGFKLEQAAVNEATFRVADQRGWQVRWLRRAATGAHCRAAKGRLASAELRPRCWAPVLLCPTGTGPARAH